MSQVLPARANLAYLKKLCKDRLKQLRASGKSAKLAALQRQIARDYGFLSWAKLKSHVEKQSLSQPAEHVDADTFLTLVADGDTANVQEALRQNPALATTQGKHPTWGGRPFPIHVAIERNHQAIFNLLLTTADLNTAPEAYGRWSPLMLAIHWKRDSMRDALLARRATVGLIEALMLSDDAAVQRLLQTSGILNSPWPNDATPLHFARTKAAVEWLLAAGITPHKKDIYEKNALKAIAALGAVALPAVQALLAAGVTADPITLAQLGDLAALQALPLRVVLSEGTQTLHTAASRGHLPIVQWLLDAGIDVSARQNRGATPLHSAAWEGQLAIARFLVQRGADINAVDDQHKTPPAIWARTAQQMFQRPGCGEVAEFLESLPGNNSSSQGSNDADAFLDAGVDLPNLSDRTPMLAKQLLRAHPSLSDASIYAAAAAGSSSALAQWLQKDPALATTPGGIRNWPPLLYISFSLLLRYEKSAAHRRDFAQCARQLLAAGADPNAHFVNPSDQVKESALYGASGRARDPAITKLLLDAGADVNDGESLYHATETLDHSCLKLLLAQKPSNISFCLCHKLDHEDPAGVRLFLQYGADPNLLLREGALDIHGLRPLHFAILRNRSVTTIRALLKGGADPSLKTAGGMTPYAFALRLGRKKIAAALRSKTSEPLSPTELFLAACSAGNAKTARKLLSQNPGLITNLSSIDAALLPAAAAEGRLPALKLMLDLGFPIETIGPWGGTSLHQAAWAGHTRIVKLLLDRGAKIDARQQWGGDAVQTAIHGSVHGNHAHGPEIVRLLASRLAPSDWDRYLQQARNDGLTKIAEVLQTIASSASDDPAIQALPEHRRTHKIAAWKPIMDAAFTGDAPRIKKLLAAGADPNIISTTPAQYRPLHRAVEYKKTQPRSRLHEDAVQALLQGGADPHLRGGWEKLTALAQAAVGEIRFVPLLRDRFLPLDIFCASVLADEPRVAHLLKKDRLLATAKDANGLTALHYASQSAYCLFGDNPQASRQALLAIARLLIDAGANVSATYLWEDQWPIPVLFGCCGKHDFPEMAEFLIRAGATPCDGESVYHAADEGHSGALAVIQRLTDKKKLAAECSFALPSLLHWGRTRGILWLLQHGADPNALSKMWGNAALHETAARGSSEKVIALLLQFGADPKRKNKAGKTPLQIAQAAGHAKIIKQLGG